MDFEDIYSEQVQNAEDGDHFVEIGAWKGKSTAYMAVEIFNSQKDIRFDVIDTWAGSPTESQQKVIRQGVDVYEKFLENLEPVIDVINPIKSDSVQASLRYEDESLDFVFIDGNHLYQNCKYDIQSYLPKVKKGGVISGHDWRAHPEVQKAVREFFTEDQIQIKHRSWYVQL